MQEKVPEQFGKHDAQPHVYTAYSDAPSTSKAFADFKKEKKNTGSHKAAAKNNPYKNELFL